MARFSGVYLLCLTFAVFALWDPDVFLTRTTITGIIGDQAITVVLTLGLLLALAAGSFDLSAGQNLGLAAVTCAWLSFNLGWNPLIIVLLTTAIGCVIGAVNGFLVVVLDVNSFVATLGMSSILLAVTQVVSSNNFIGPLPTDLQELVSWQWFSLSGVTFIGAAGCVLVWVFLEHTPTGRRIAATGANRDAARLTGVPTELFRFTTLVISGGTASLAGALLAAKLGSVAPTVGPSYLLPAFAACFLSTTQIKPGRFNVVGLVIALLLLGTGITGLQLQTGKLWIANLFTGVALVLAVALAVWEAKRRAARMADLSLAE